MDFSEIEMSTQQEQANEIKIGEIIKQMISNGMQRTHAVAVGMAMEHALQCPVYKSTYGTFLVDELQAFIDSVPQ